MFEFKEISFLRTHKEMQPLFEEHWEETAFNKGVRKLNVAVDLFIELEKRGLFLAVGVYKDGLLVGYTLSIKTIDTHDCTRTIMGNDAVFISRPYREGYVGIKLIKVTEELAKQRGANTYVWHVKPNTALDKLMQLKNYTVADILYKKEL